MKSSKRLVILAVLLLTAAPASAQVPASVAAERDAFARWLAHATVSPYAAVAQLRIGPGIRLGPADADLALAGIASHQVSITRGIARISGPEGTRELPRGRVVPLGRYAMVAGGSAEGPIITVFDSSRSRGAPQWYPYDRSLVFTGPLLPPDAVRSRRVLTPDGVEVLATTAGSVLVPIAGKLVRLSVMQFSDSSSGQSDLEIYFRDSTSGDGTYPAGRFVSLTPAANGRWRLDLNRARSPFCSYSSAYACPAPWRGNVISAPVRAGEQYHSSE